MRLLFNKNYKDKKSKRNLKNFNKLKIKNLKPKNYKKWIKNELRKTDKLKNKKKQLI